MIKTMILGKVKKKLCMIKSFIKKFEKFQFEIIITKQRILYKQQCNISYNGLEQKIHMEPSLV